MSKYEDYDSVAENYDNHIFSKPLGADVMAALIQLNCEKPLKEIHVLDAGCGTGNYAKALLDLGIGHMTLLDASHGMLNKAQEKLAVEIASGRVKEVKEATIPPLPFPDSSFDAVTFNLVLQHLDLGESRFPVASQTMAEARRVVRSEGVVSVLTCLPTTMSSDLWMTEMCPSLTERFNKHNPSVEDVETMMKSAGIQCRQKVNILPTFATKEYFNMEGPLDPSWRRSLAYWTDMTAEELREIENKIKSLKQKDELEKWGYEHDHTTTKGILTLFVGKP